MVRAMMAADASVATEVTAVRDQMTDLIMQAMRNGDGPSEDDAAYANVLQDVWFARQIAWLGGRTDSDSVWAEIDEAIKLVLR
jgi:hypothetical protein